MKKEKFPVWDSVLFTAMSHCTVYNNSHWLTELFYRDTATLNLLVFITSQLIKNNLHTMCVTIVSGSFTFQDLPKYTS